MATATTTKAARTRKASPAAPTTFRMLLALGGTAYWVRPITSALHAKAFRLRRADGRGEHYVTQDEHGHHCDCGDFIWRHAGRGTACKHIRALRASRLLDPTPPPAPPATGRTRDEWDTP
jgi:hypothetical protein